MPDIPPVSPAISRPDAAASPRATQEAGDAFEAMFLEKILAAARPAQSPNNDWTALANRAFAETIAAAHPFDIGRMLNDV